MKNKPFWLHILSIELILLISLISIIGCNNDPDDKNSIQSQGIFTLTDIPAEYDGKYAYLEVQGGGFDLYGEINVSNNMFIGARISNGSVKIPVSYFFEEDKSLVPYFGSNTVYYLYIFIAESSTTMEGVPDDWLVYITFEMVKFSNGNAAKSWNEGVPENRNPGTSGLYAKAPPVRAFDNSVDLSGTAGNTVIEKTIAYINNNPGVYTLLLDNDISVDTMTLGTEYLRILSEPNVNLTILGLDQERKISLTGTGPIFIVGSHIANHPTITLTIGNNVTLVGRGGNNQTAVGVRGGAHFIMQDNSKIMGNSANNANGGGVFVTRAGGDGAKFTMQDDAMITGNSAYNGGGVYVDANTTFTMCGNAVIHGNSVGNINFGGGVHIYGVNSVGLGTFNMEGGTISGNIAASGGGVYTNGIFNMSGGIIYGSSESEALANKATQGATLSINYGTAKYSDGTNIISGTWTNNTITGK